jgi:hypothetical protein
MSLLGHSVALIALNDSFATEEPGWIFNREEPCVARLPAHLAPKERWERAGRLITEFNPDWISLHFVCYGFHPRGLVGGMAVDLAKLVEGRRLHLMMHELWVMWGMDCRLRDRLIGVLQRRGVLRVLRALRPSLIDTTIPFYQAVLRHEGFEAGLLPLCGNFPVVPGDALSWLPQRLEAACLPGLWPSSEPLLVAGFFGTIFGHWDPQPLMKRLANEAAARGTTVLLLSGGSCSEEGARLFNGLPSEVDGIRFHRCRLGRLSDEQASQYFNSMDLGLSGYSKLFIGKSSVVATMLDHGLTVIAGGDDTKLQRGWEVDFKSAAYVGVSEALPESLTRITVSDSSRKVTDLLLTRLANC